MGTTDRDRDRTGRYTAVSGSETESPWGPRHKPDVGVRVGFDVGVRRNPHENVNTSETETEGSSSDSDSGSDDPFRILVLGPLAPGSALPPLAQRKPLRVDPDNFSKVLTRLGVQITLDPALAGSPLLVTSLDVLEPDYLYEHTKLFAELRSQRAAVSNARTAMDAIQKLEDAGLLPNRQGPRPSPSPSPSSPTPPPAPPAGDVLGMILGATREERTGTGAGASAGAGATARPGVSPMMAEYFQEVTQGHTIRLDEARQSEVLAFLDGLCAERMRAVLHDPAFRAVESVWRGVAFLVKRLDLGVDLQLEVLPVTREELDTDAGESALRGIMQAPGRSPYAVISALWTVAPTRDDAIFADRLARLAGSMNAACFLGASSTFVGCDDLVARPDPDDWTLELPSEGIEAWSVFRTTPDARRLGLALPRVLLRPPYGSEQTIDAFPFEEITAAETHEDYLWGNPGLVCACALGLAFQSHGWSLRPGVFRHFENMPIHIDRLGEDPRVVPPAETLLTDRAVETIVSCGVIPLAPFANRDALAVAGFSSWAGALIAGRWK